MGISLTTGADMNLDQMQRFGKINAMDSRHTLVFNSSGNLDGGGKLNPLASKLTRSSATIAANNDVRTELLRNLGKTFNLSDDDMGKCTADGKFSFSSEFVKKLEEKMGGALKFDDFGIDADKGGVVSSGKPLTERRMTAINEKLSELKGGPMWTSTRAQMSAAIRLMVQGNQFLKHFLPCAGDDYFRDLIDDIVVACAKIHETGPTFMKLEGEAGWIKEDILDNKKFMKKLTAFYNKARNDLQKCTREADVNSFADKVEAELKNLVAGFLRANSGNLVTIEPDVLEFGNETSNAIVDDQDDESL